MDFITAFVDQAMIANGADPAVITARGGSVRGVTTNGENRSIIINSRQPRWTDEENEFMAANLGRMTLAEIGAALGRTENAVKVHQVRCGFKAPTRQPGWLTAHQVCNLLGVDSHVIPGYIRDGIIPGEFVAFDNRRVMRVKFEDLKYWITRPQNFPYIKMERMKPGYLRRLVEKAHARWGDEWITMREMAEMHGIDDVKMVTNHFMKGHLPGLHILNLSGRDKGGWGYWFVRRSVAEKWIRPRLSDLRVDWATPAARDFMLRMSAQGFNSAQIGKMMKRPQKTVNYLIRKFKLELPEEQQVGAMKVKSHRGKGKKHG
jgi:DNA-binding CsgD family transcriptional regulator